MLAQNRLLTYFSEVYKLTFTQVFLGGSLIVLRVKFIFKVHITVCHDTHEARVPMYVHNVHT